jgi:hypothetical protein
MILDSPITPHVLFQLVTIRTAHRDHQFPQRHVLPHTAARVRWAAFLFRRPVYIAPNLWPVGAYKHRVHAHERRASSIYSYRVRFIRNGESVADRGILLRGLAAQTTNPSMKKKKTRPHPSSIYLYLTPSTSTSISARHLLL